MNLKDALPMIAVLSLQCAGFQIQVVFQLVLVADYIISNGNLLNLQVQPSAGSMLVSQPFCTASKSFQPLKTYPFHRVANLKPSLKSWSHIAISLPLMWWILYLVSFKLWRICIRPWTILFILIFNILTGIRLFIADFKNNDESYLTEHKGPEEILEALIGSNDPTVMEVMKPFKFKLEETHQLECSPTCPMPQGRIVNPPRYETFLVEAKIPDEAPESLDQLLWNHFNSVEEAEGTKKLLENNIHWMALMFEPFHFRYMWVQQKVEEINHQEVSWATRGYDCHNQQNQPWSGNWSWWHCQSQNDKNQHSCSNQQHHQSSIWSQQWWNPVSVTTMLCLIKNYSSIDYWIMLTWHASNCTLFYCIRFDLQSCVKHQGSASSGHFHSHIGGRGARFCRFDDSSPIVVSTDEELSQCQLYFFTKRWFFTLI